MNKRLKFEMLPAEEQNFLTQIYGLQTGYTLKKILYVEEIETDKKFFFDKNNFVSSSFFVQKLYKVSGQITPLKFNLTVSKLIEKTDELRMNYCTVDNRTLKIIFESRKEIPHIVYRNLSNAPDIDSTLQNILEADMRQPCDLRHDNLIRFSVFHTGEEEYAVLITMPQLIVDSFDVRNFFRSVLNLEPLANTEKQIFEFPVQSLEPIKNYWTKILQNLPPMPQLPFSIIEKNFVNQKAYRATIPAAIMSDLREKAGSNKIMLMSIFQAAWAIILQEFNNVDDVAFSALIPDRKTANLNSIPVRIKSSDSETVQNIVNSQFKQIIISQPYACNNFSIIQKILRPQNKTFDHFLSFGDFMKEEQPYSQAAALPDGNLVLQNSWNTQNTKLGIYFHYSENSTTSISILYNANKFSSNFGALISERFLFVIQQILTDWNLDYKNFLERLRFRLQVEPSAKEDDTVYLQHFISQLKILQNKANGNLQRIIKIAKLTTYFEGDRISGKEMEENLIFVAEGKLVRSIDTGDGWYNTLDIVKENRWINEIVLLENCKTKLSAEVLTENAILMSIPLEEMKKIFKEIPSAEHEFLIHILKEMEKYQRLWIQS